MGSKQVVVRWGLVLGLLVFSASPAPAASGRYYVSLGTSLAAGTQPGSLFTNVGYADQLHRLLQVKDRRLQLVKLGCPGETTVSMITGKQITGEPSLCTYRGGSQLKEAVAFLKAKGDAVALVTIDMGANDLLPCVGEDGAIDVPCIGDAFGNVYDNLPFILTALREAAGPGVPIVAMNYYNPFVAAWLQGPDGRALALESAFLLGQFNDLLEGIYAFFAVPVGDVARAFRSDDFITIVPRIGLPINVVLVCQLTWMCTPPPQGPDIHPNRSGYFVIALVLVAALK
jgi:lysophospholipase L1-like esterase